MTASTTRTLTFEAVKLPVLAAGIDSLNKIAAKLGADPITYTVVERTAIKRAPLWFSIEDCLTPCPVELLEDVEAVVVEVTGSTPQLPGGWFFVGSIEHLDAGNLVHGDDPALGAYRTAEPDCAHCGLRRDRKRTIVLRNAEGELAQVGSTCLKDFLGYHGDPEKFLAILDRFERLDGELSERGPYIDYGVPTESFLTVTATAIRVVGWRAKSSGLFPTSAIVEQIFGLGVRLNAKNDAAEIELVRKVSDALQTVDPADVAKAAAVAEWAKTLDGNDNYLGNVKVAVGGERVLQRHFGIAASAVSAYDKDTARKLERAERDAAEAAEIKVPVPAGNGVVVEGTVLYTQWRENDYGGSLKVLLKCAGFKLWGTVPRALGNPEQGSVIRFVANVERSHDDESFGFFQRPRKAELLSAAVA